MRKVVLPIVMFLSLFLLLGASTVSHAAQTTGGVIDDSTITAAVKAELAKDVRLGTLTGVEVTTNQGVVSLSGKVRNKEEKKFVEKVAGDVEGVVKVNSRLQIENE